MLCLNGKLIPWELLASHLTLLRLPAHSDGAGRCTIGGLPPGTYEVLLGYGASEATIAEGGKYGYVSTVTLDAQQVAELEVQGGS